MAEETNIPGPPYSGPAIKPILDSISSPADMKRLDMRQLKQVRNDPLSFVFNPSGRLLISITIDSRLACS
jgi:hypothetical protein